MKNEGSNFNAMTFALKSVVSYNFDYETLGLQESSNNTCFGHVISIAWQYAIATDIVCKNLNYVLIKANL